ncbi:MAG: hypothetical protein V2I43_00695 [Parvularcula sp.]|nr:hypothetical protein [Parvularcula sp.]
MTNLFKIDGPRSPEPADEGDLIGVRFLATKGERVVLLAMEARIVLYAYPMTHVRGSYAAGDCVLQPGERTGGSSGPPSIRGLHPI